MQNTPNANENATEEKKQWDFFISHADEDKKEIAMPLADALNAKGLMGRVAGRHCWRPAL